MSVKSILILLCVVCVLIPIITYGAAITMTIQMGAQCIDYFRMAADANNVELAERYLGKGIEYLEEHNLTSGSTKILYYSPTNDIGLWYENLKTAQTTLQELLVRDELSELEESNVLMKLREVLRNNDGSITHPTFITFYPNHTSWFWTNVTIWLLWIVAGILGGLASDVY